MAVRKITFIILLLLLCNFSVFAREDQIYILLNAPLIKDAEVNTPVTNYPGDDTLPRNWRICSDPFKNKEEGTRPTRDGLDTLNISGSGSFSTGQFEKMREALGDRKVIIVDLRQEFHGILNNMCIGWENIRNNPNAGKTQEEILLQEKELLDKVKEEKGVTINNMIKKTDASGTVTREFIKIPVHVESVMTEEELVTGYNYGYYRITVTDGYRPDDKQVDNFITFYKNLSPDTWLHFHCKAGRGRTTTFMTMYDMMRNYDKAGGDDIIKRQWLLGGAKLSEKPVDEAEKDRWDFIVKFYDYCRQNGPDYKILWSEWIMSASGKN
ncbi:MAG: phosphatase [Candidatus Eremiobacterota bacterium]